MTRAINLYASGTWTHATYSSSPYFLVYAPPTPIPLYPNGFGKVVDATDNALERAPRWSSSVGGEFTFQLPQGRVVARGNWYYNSGYFWDPSNLYRQNAYSLLTASVDYVFPHDQWTVSAWGTNLGNKDVLNFYYPIPTGTLTTDAPPRMFGATLRFKFR